MDEVGDREEAEGVRLADRALENLGVGHAAGVASLEALAVERPLEATEGC